MDELADCRSQIDRDALYASAFLLQSFYTGAERILKRLLKICGTDLADNGNWHAELLWIASQSRENIHPAILSESTQMLLDDFRAFRHVARTRYGFEMKPEKIAALTNKLEVTQQQFRAEIDAFLTFVEAASD